MLDLIRKRHEGDGWIVFTELANRPGFAAKRYADAFALGVWQSTKYEGHLYEEKQSREDLKKELRDPSKAEGVGKYAKYWWLCVADEKILEGLVIPEVWGILTPQVRGGSKILKVVRKAPKLDPRPMDALFAMSMIRCALKSFVSKTDHQRVLEKLSDLERGRSPTRTTEEEALHETNIRLEAELKALKGHIGRFEEASGLKIADEGYNLGNIGRAVKIVYELNQNGEGFDALGQHVRNLSDTADHMASTARNAAHAAIRLRASLGLAARDHDARCERKQVWNGFRCSCGKEPASAFEAAIEQEMLAKSLSDGAVTVHGDGGDTRGESDEHV